MGTTRNVASIALLLLAVSLFACGPAAPGAQSEPDATVVFYNPGQTPVPLPTACNCAPHDNGANAVGWSAEPVIAGGALTMQGTVAVGMRLSQPTDGEPPAFLVHFGDNAEVLVALLPDLAPTYIWDTDHTVAPSDITQTGNSFTVRAYSPLFMDVGTGDYRLAVWGYDAAGKRIMLSSLPVGVE